ncbi:MAG: rod shape-determining protein MreC, partial [Hymenobacter sp.]|nr:rod shape-determining protein MreC [Hymenobacter sp.]
TTFEERPQVVATITTPENQQNLARPRTRPARPAAPAAPAKSKAQPTSPAATGPAATTEAAG